MSKSENPNTNQRLQGRLALALMAGGLAAGCAGNDPWTIDPQGYDGIGQQTFEVLANPCVITAPVGVGGVGTMALSVAATETLYLSLRAADNVVIADGVTGGGAECAVPASYRISVTETGTTGVEKVFLDYINGPFALGTTVASVVTPGITMALGATSSLIVRGSSGADKIYLGSTYTASVLQHSWINVNGDTSPDVRMDGVTFVKVSTGVGADIISADGGNGTTGSSLDVGIAFSAFGGPDADTLTGGAGPSTLDGGDGDDKFIQTLTVGADNIVGGKGMDTVDYSLRTAPVSVTVCTVCATGCATARTTCITSPNPLVGADAKKVACDATATSAHTTCIAPAHCPVDGTQVACIAACDTVETTAFATCVTNHTTDVNTCISNEATCALTSGTGGTPQLICEVCVADDGAANEGDTINDDVEIVLGGKGNDTINATSAVCSDGATVPTVKCTLKGNDGDDTLIGSSHNDLIDGGNGNDLLQGGLGDDTLIGGAGFDTVSYADRINPLTVLKVSLDSTKLWLAGQNGDTGENDSIAADVENLTGGAGNDFLRGNALANIIHGGLGNDTIEGGAGNDSLYGDAGNDLLYGGAGNDMLVGGLGADVLVGGDGDDFLDSAETPGAADTVLECDGNNDSTGTAGTSPGTADALVKDASDVVTALNCEL